MEKAYPTKIMDRSKVTRGGVGRVSKDNSPTISDEKQHEVLE